MHTQTRRQREVLDLIARYIDTHGYRPSYQTIARLLGLRSRAGIARIVQDLESQGLLARHREDGHFSIEMKNHDASILIQWLDVPEDTVTRDDRDFPPLTLPAVLLGGYDPDTVRVFQVRDDAMAADHICEGDIAITELREFARDGQAVVAVIDKQRTVLRKYYRAGAEIELRTADDAGEVISVAANHVEIVGIYRGLIRPAI